jgi:AcrR family transcriptional regulator
VFSETFGVLSNDMCSEHLTPETTAQTGLSRRDRRRLDTREEILVAARELMLEVGPEALSLRQVARRADFSPAALYTYFASRDELVATLFAESFERLDAYLRRVPTDLPLRERVVELGMAYMDFARDNPMDLRCVLIATPQEGLPSSSGTALGLSAMRLISEPFREAMQQGLLGTDPMLGPAELAYACWALVHGMVSISGIDLSEVAHEVSADPRRVLEAFVTLLVTPRPE